MRPPKRQKIATRITDSSDGHTATLSSAASRALGTEDILELILKDATISPRTVLLSTRVNKTFHRIVQNSPSLRRKIWFNLGDDARDGYMNPILELNMRLDTKTMFAMEVHGQAVPVNDLSRILINPILRIRNFDSLASVPDGTWRKMQLYNTNLRDDAVLYLHHQFERTRIWHYITDLRLNKPTTLGEVVDFILKRGCKLCQRLAAEKKMKQEAAKKKGKKA